MHRVLPAAQTSNGKKALGTSPADQHQKGLFVTFSTRGYHC